MDKLIYLFPDKLKTDPPGNDDTQERSRSADDVENEKIELSLEVLMQREFGVSDPRDLTYEQVAYLARIFKTYKMAFNKLRNLNRAASLD